MRTWPRDEREFYDGIPTPLWIDPPDRDRRLAKMRAAKVITALRELEPEVVVRSPQSRLVLVDVPAVPFGPDGDPDQVDADYYRSAARGIRYQASLGNTFAGSNLTETVARLVVNTANALELAIRRRERGSFFPYGPEECPNVQAHRGPAGPNEDVSVCYLCGSPSFGMRAEGEHWGWHIPDCSLPLNHAGECVPGGAGHGPMSEEGHRG